MRGSSRLSCEGCPLLSGPHDMQSTLSVEKSSVQDAKVRVCDREREETETERAGVSATKVETSKFGGRVDGTR